MWEDAKKIVEDEFFKDEIYLYRNDIETDSIGEEHYKEVLVGAFKCNLQYDPTSVRTDINGKAIAQTMRISIQKDVPVDYANTYKIKIKTARIMFDDTYWKVESWRESLMSTVMIVLREVKV